ncbi:hypothetical protein D3C76_1760760 [compost metagenome]
MFSIDNLRIVWPALRGIRHVIPQVVQGLHDDAERFTAVMALQVFHVLQHKDCRAAGVNNARHVKEQRALSVAGKTVRATQSVLL